jgi:hypothetical protein
LAAVLAIGGIFSCGRSLKIDLTDLALHNRIEHDASLTHANAQPGARYAPIPVDKELLHKLLDASRNPDTLSFDDLVSVRANRDATLNRPLSWVHGTIAKGEVALTVQLFGDEEGNMPKKYLQEWFGEERLPQGWFKPIVTIGLWSTTRISNWVGHLLKQKSE